MERGWWAYLGSLATFKAARSVPALEGEGASKGIDAGLADEGAFLPAAYMVVEESYVV